MKKLLGAMCLFFVGGCVHATHFVGPHGESMVSLRCNGAGVEMADCYNKAHEECGGNFDVADQNEHTEYVTQTNATKQGFSSTTQAIPERNLVVICRAGAAAPAQPVAAQPPAQDAAPVATPVAAPPPSAPAAQ